MPATSQPIGTILLIEDEPMLRVILGDHLRDRGLNVLEAANGPLGLELFHKHRPAVISLDLRMAPMDGHEVLAAIRETDQDTPVIILTGQSDKQDVIRMLRAGAFDFLLKPIDDMTIFDNAIDRALERYELKRDFARLSQSFLAAGPQNPEDFGEILTVDPRMRDIFRYCEAVAQSGEPFLITGETGVGKELLARAIHRSSRRSGAFVAVNVAGLDDQTFSDTLFGHVRGAYTGADKAREGLMEKAWGGTLFLDEVGELSTQSQVRLLRVLQEREFYPLGGDTARPLTARVLAATNKPLTELRAGESLRKDFFFRLATHSVELPPLRERKGDIVPLFRHFLAQAVATMKRPQPKWSDDLEALLSAYSFPGNIRELKALSYDALGRCDGETLDLRAFPHLSNVAPESPRNQQEIFSTLQQLPTIRSATEALIAEALQRANGVQKRAAAILGITPQSLNERLKRA